MNTVITGESRILDNVGTEQLYQLSCDATDLSAWLSQNGFSAKRDYIREEMAQLIPPFCQHQATLITRYLDGLISLNDVSQTFLSYLIEKNISLDVEILYQCLTDYADDVDRVVKNIIQGRSYQQALNMLGFGLCEGHYEIELANFSLDINIADEILLYGYDPSTSYAMPSRIQCLTKNDLKNLDHSESSFDLMLARWVLHHTDPTDRWEDIIVALNACKNGADIIIVEESWLPSINESNVSNYRFKELLLGFFDIIVNIALHMSWMFNKECPNFYLQYLRQEDFEQIESKINRPFQKKIYSLDYSLLSQHIIHYKLLDMS